MECKSPRIEEIQVVFDDAGKEVIMVNPAVLTLASPVFRNMLSHDMEEKREDRIVLKGKDPEEFKTLISFLMPGSSRSQTISTKNADFLLKWSDEYCIDVLKEECMAFIKKQPPSLDRVLQAHAFGMQDYLVHCVRSLLEAGLEDWGAIDDPDLWKVIFEQSLKHISKLNVELKMRGSKVDKLNEELKDRCLRWGHTHKGGRLDAGHSLRCARCNRPRSEGWRCSACI